MTWKDLLLIALANSVFVAVVVFLAKKAIER
jgi:hypothetical protein